MTTIKATDVKQMWRDDLAAFLEALGGLPLHMHTAVDSVSHRPLECSLVDQG